MDHELCPKCKFQLSPANYFCPNCGQKIKEPPVSTTIGKQMGIYLLSFFLPPLGLWPGIKYFRQKGSKAQIIGVVAILLTLLSIIISVWLMAQTYNSITSTLNTQLGGAGLGL